MIKLNIGCGTDIKEDYHNIDAYVDHPKVKKMNMIKLEYKDNSVDFIYAHHCLEHANYRHTLSILKEWYRVLKRGGVAEVYVPDTEECMKRWLALEKLDFDFKKKGYSYQQIWGQQRHPGLYHHTGFKKSTIAEWFEKAGFLNIEVKSTDDGSEITVICKK